MHVFTLPLERETSGPIKKGIARVYTHKGEWLQGPIPLTVGKQERYTMGVFSLLDDLNSAFVDVRKIGSPSGEGSIGGKETFAPAVEVQPNGWNAGEVELVKRAVVETWREFGRGERCGYKVYGYHDIRVGAGSGSSSALVQAAIRATAAEHGQSPDDKIASIHGRVESGADPLHLSRPAVVATRRNLGRPVRPLGDRNPNLQAVAWSTGPKVLTSEVRFEYNDEELLLWRVRWASLERAIRAADDARVARLAMESARENQKRNRQVDFALLEEGIVKFGALGFAVAHTGSYHVALFAASTGNRELAAYKDYVLGASAELADRKVEIFNTAQAAERRFVS